MPWLAVASASEIYMIYSFPAQNLIDMMHSFSAQKFHQKQKIGIGRNDASSATLTIPKLRWYNQGPLPALLCAHMSKLQHERVNNEPLQPFSFVCLSQTDTELSYGNNVC